MFKTWNNLYELLLTVCQRRLAAAHKLTGDPRCFAGMVLEHTLPTALAAPVEEGMMLDDALRPPRQSFLLGPSTVFCVAARAHQAVGAIKESMQQKKKWLLAGCHQDMERHLVKV